MAITTNTHGANSSLMHEYEMINRELHENYASKTYPAYQNHFQFSREGISEASQGLSGRALILGVGGAHDIPIEKIAEQFEEVILVDIELHLWPQVIERVAPELRGRVTAYQLDLTGYLAQISMKAEEIAQHESEENFWPKTFAMIKNLKRDIPDLSLLKASFIVSSLLSTQLSHELHVELERIFLENYKNPTSSRVMEPLCDFIAQVEINHIKDLHKWILPQGKIYFADHVAIKRVQTLNFFNGQGLISQEPPIPMASADKVTTCLRDHFQVLKSQEWDWEVSSHTAPCQILNGPKIGTMKMDEVFHIMAYIAEKK